MNAKPPASAASSAAPVAASSGAPSGGAVSASEIRSAFIRHFTDAGHEHVASSPLVPRNDPTLMFANSGMVQFKNVFTGAEARAYKRAVTSQKCVRAGGKHNDLENVGRTARHHTFFEMLGNFSFGDYFKDTAIELAWSLITKEYGLPADRLLVTVHTSDEDAAVLWRKIAGLPDEKIIRIPTSDNFWAMGETGPCGPCSEIFYDHGPDVPGGPPGSPDEDGDRFIEIWNLVFMQFEQVTPEQRVDLPRPSIDTGMGLERITAVLQGTYDNYAIDLLRSLIEASADLTSTDPDGEGAVSHRVIADHMRASSFLIADGVTPSNEGRGYVLRRIMRRAMRHVHMLGAKDPLMHRLLPALTAKMGQAFPELLRAEALIGETLKLEENRFKTTLDRGLRLLDEAAEGLGEGGVLAGETAFTLYDTYGFPVDLTQDALRARGAGVDMAGFKAAMAAAKAEARKAWAGSGEQAEDAVWMAAREDAGATDFLGYATENAEGVVTAIVVDGARVESINAWQKAEIALNQTPFYGESGGQMGDMGTAESDGGGYFRITDTQKRGGGDIHVHIGELEKGALAVGEAVKLRVYKDRRTQLRANHSATHLLHKALRRRLGEHVTQKGSLVAPNRLRFDFSHPKPLELDDLNMIETEVNAQIWANSEVTTRLMTPDAAVEAGALALFGEKYGDEVRVVSMGGFEEQTNGVFSTELCGGTHVRRTGDIGLLKIISESAVAAGVRRIEALTGQAALDHLAARDTALQTLAAAFKTPPEDVPARVAALQEERKRLEREVSDLRRTLAVGGGGGGGGASGAAETEDINGVTCSMRLLNGVPAKDLKSLADDLKKQMGSGVVALAGVDDGKVSLVVGVTDDLTGACNAVDLVRRAAAAVGGKGGGGRPDMAQAGGPDAANAQAALDAVKEGVKAAGAA
ncbi:MAG: alanine--tRNA ligase [Rhodospirillales bacterium]